MTRHHTTDEKELRKAKRDEIYLLKKEKKDQEKLEKSEKRQEKREKIHAFKQERKEKYVKHRRRSTKGSSEGGVGWSILKILFTFLHVLVSKIVSSILEMYWGEKKRCPPLTSNFFITRSATELAKRIRSKELTSYEVVEAYIERANAINPSVNFIIDGPFSEEALAEAKAIDERIEKNQISEDEFSEKPFLGVPFTTKDSTAVKLKLQTLGILARRNVKAKEDAECIRRIKEAGGIILATTNIPEINRWQESRNMIIGQTNNPYDLRRTCGGSSGGEAAGISACGSAFGIGTDIGGSIRMPSFYCGIFGHYPTGQTVSTRGCTLRTGNEGTTMVGVGAMTRYAEDLMPIFKVLTGPENVAALKLDEPVDLTKLRYFYITESGDLKVGPISTDLKDGMRKVVDHFMNLSDEPVQATSLTGTNSTTKLWRFWMTQEPADFSKLLGNGIKLNPIVELLKKMTGKSEFTLASIYCLLDTLLPAQKESLMRDITKKLSDEFEVIFLSAFFANFFF